jgi:predicted nucleic acid-binding protein
LKRILLDTNLYIDWLDRGAHESLILGSGLVHYLSAVVVLELRVRAKTRGARHAVDQLVRAYDAGGRLVAPTPAAFDRAGSLLRKLKLAGREIRSASLVNDVLIASTARLIGATVVTTNIPDFEEIQALETFSLEGPMP